MQKGVVAPAKENHCPAPHRRHRLNTHSLPRRSRRCINMEVIMMLEKTLAKEIRKAAPARTQDQDSYFAFLNRVKEAARDMSVTTIRADFDKLSAKHGRAVTAVVLAATLYERRERLDCWNLDWACDTLRCWPHTAGTLESAAIHDGIHPTAICDYAAGFIWSNTDL